MRTEMNPYIVDVPTGLFGWGSKSKDTGGVASPWNETRIQKKLRVAAQEADKENEGKLT